MWYCFFNDCLFLLFLIISYCLKLVLYFISSLHNVAPHKIQFPARGGEVSRLPWLDRHDFFFMIFWNSGQQTLCRTNIVWSEYPTLFFSSLSWMSSGWVGDCRSLVPSSVPSFCFSVSRVFLSSALCLWPVCSPFLIRVPAAADIHDARHESIMVRNNQETRGSSLSSIRQAFHRHRLLLRDDTEPLSNAWQSHTPSITICFQN